MSAVNTGHHRTIRVSVKRGPKRSAIHPPEFQIRHRQGQRLPQPSPSAAAQYASTPGYEGPLPICKRGRVTMTARRNSRAPTRYRYLTRGPPPCDSQLFYAPALDTRPSASSTRKGPLRVNPSPAIRPRSLCRKWSTIVPASWLHPVRRTHKDREPIVFPTFFPNRWLPGTSMRRGSHA